MAGGTFFSSHAFARAALTLGLTGAVAIGAVPACSSGEDFTAKNTGGASNTGGNAGDAGTTGGAGGSAATGGGGVAGSGTGGVAGAGSGGVAGSGSGGVAGSASGGTGGNPGGKANGATCALQSECLSNYCVDGVCCESECTGVCKTCSESGKEGVCTPYAQGTDPEANCVGSGKATDTCAGKCDGKGACTFPAPTDVCGAAVCASGTASTFACDSAGGCKKTDQACGNFACGSTACLTQCTQDNQCISTAYCETPACKAKKPLGAICPSDNQCQSNICAVGNCCNTACSAPADCGTGACLCGGVACDTGQACVAWYKDADGDGFGSQNQVYACANKKPTGYVSSNTDCADDDADAFPGQTKFFTAPRKVVGGYDYNCDKLDTPFYGNVTGKTCGRCAPGGFCNSFGCDMGWGCNPSGCSGDGPADGYFGNIACGQPATLQRCFDNPGVSGCQNGTGSQANTYQLCR